MSQAPGVTIETIAGASPSMVLNMGPQHPSTHGVLRVVLELDGEIVRTADPMIGYLHTGIEKSCESKTYSQAITLTDRIDYLAPLSNNLCYCLAAERLIGLEVPKRAQYIRVLLTELTRITSHLVWLGTHADRPQAQVHIGPTQVHHVLLTEAGEQKFGEEGDFRVIADGQKLGQFLLSVFPGKRRNSFGQLHLPRDS